MRNSTLHLGETGRPVEGFVISAEGWRREQERECSVGQLETRRLWVAQHQTYLLDVYSQVSVLCFIYASLSSFSSSPHPFSFRIVLLMLSFIFSCPYNPMLASVAPSSTSQVTVQSPVLKVRREEDI
jgi:hypothetical protein